MTKESIPLVAVVALCLGAQSADLEKWNTVGRMCGKAEWLERTHKHNPDSFDERRKPIKKAEVRLYRREGGAPCCGAEAPVASATTGRNGTFKLADVVPAKYWVVIVAEGKEFSLGVTYAPDPKGSDDTSCSDLLYDVTEGKLQLGRVITVD